MIDSNRDFFETLAKVLLRCWVFGFCLLLLWFGAYMLAGGAALKVHNEMFGLSKHELDLVFYCGMGLLKLCVLLFFVFPWIAIRLVLRKGPA